VTIIDAGVPGYYKDIDRELAVMGRRPRRPGADPHQRAFRPHWLRGATAPRAAGPYVGARGRRALARGEVPNRRRVAARSSCRA
jgi:hypothetical protein